MSTPAWAVGVTTVPERREAPLPRTLRSISKAGFPAPWVFVDGDRSQDRWAWCDNVTLRHSRVGTFGSWYLGMLELLVRFPQSDRFVIFQDDVQCVGGLKPYLDMCKYPTNGYWNLFTFLDSEKVTTGKCGWVEGPMLGTGIDPAQTWQAGRGALGLAFSREAVMTLLKAPSFVNKPCSTEPKARLDGAVVTAMNCAGWREYVHGPSLLWHTGVDSTMGTGKRWRAESNAHTWPGEDVDIRQLMASASPGRK